MLFAIAVGITLIQTRGIWVYYGDFNVQQIPFYMHLHDLIRSGNLLYDWSTDLGGSVLGCYSFYILGSPFFWLTIPFPSVAVPYLIPWINALKYGVMALTSFLYIKKYTKTEEGAMLGALLYAFSGYFGVVLVYNHFHDFCAFFPLWLLAFDKLMEEKKRIAFILMTCFMAILNYYFFVGGVVFIIIYFFTKSPDWKKALRAFFCGLAGVLLSLWYLIPAISYTIGNTRLEKTLDGYDLLSYKEPTMLLGIIKNVVLLPDISGLNSMFNQSYSRVSGLGGYIPLFSISCVVAYFIIYKNKEEYGNEDRWPKRTIITCAVFAVFPVLNAMFSAFNSEYYARWFYMPVLIMCLMTAKVLEEIPEKPDLKTPLFTGACSVGVVLCFFSVAAILPTRDEEGGTVMLGSLKNPEQLMCELIFSALMLIALFVLILIVFPKMKNLRWINVAVILACFATCFTMIAEGSFLIETERKNSFISQGIKGAEYVGLPDEEVWCRIETEEDVYNYPMIYNRPSVTSFISTIPSSTIEFYEGIGLTRKVTSKLGVTRVGARTLLSSRYYLVEMAVPIEKIGRVEDKTTLNHFTIKGSTNGFEIYENDYFVPMGFSFEEYILEEEYSESEAASAPKDRALMKALILSEEDAEKYGKYMTKFDPEDINSVTLGKFIDECDERRAGACSFFETTKSGFTAVADMKSDNLLFFSVPYDLGFTAYVDGTESEIVKADYGLSAVFVPEGEHQIEFRYSLKTLTVKTIKKLVDSLH